MASNSTFDLDAFLGGVTGTVILWILSVTVMGGLWLLIKYLISKKFESVAFEKGYGYEIHSFWMCFLFDAIGYLYVIALPNRKELHAIDKLDVNVQKVLARVTSIEKNTENTADE